MSSSNDPKIVFFNGSTVPEWYYENIRLVKTDKNCKKSKEFEIDELVLHPDGMIRLVKKHSSNTSNKQFIKQVPAEIVLSETRDGMRFCPQCKKLVPAKTFGNSVKNNTPNAYCTPCIDERHALQAKPDSAMMIRKAYIDRRRLELILETGCVHEGGCVQNEFMHRMSDDYLLALFEFNHKDGGLGAGTGLQHVSSHSWFTDQRVERLNLPNINTWQELWEAEVAKCEVLCHSHHVIFGSGQTAAKRQKRS